MRITSVRFRVRWSARVRVKTGPYTQIADARRAFDRYRSLGTLADDTIEAWTGSVHSPGENLRDLGMSVPVGRRFHVYRWAKRKRSRSFEDWDSALAFKLELVADGIFPRPIRWEEINHEDFDDDHSPTA